MAPTKMLMLLARESALLSRPLLVKPFSCLSSVSSRLSSSSQMTSSESTRTHTSFWTLCLPNSTPVSRQWRSMNVPLKPTPTSVVWRSRLRSWSRLLSCPWSRLTNSRLLVSSHRRVVSCTVRQVRWDGGPGNITSETVSQVPGKHSWLGRVRPRQRLAT